MECGKLTAKLRDTVPVCFIENGKEIRRFKNIEIPDEIKRLPYASFKFDVPASGAITFKIMFEPGVLPEEWPKARHRVHRGEIVLPTTKEQKTTAKPKHKTEADVLPNQLDADKVSPPEQIHKPTIGDKNSIMQVTFDVTGDRRKALVLAIARFVGEQPKYQNPPSYAYIVGEYTIDRKGTVIGPANDALIAVLREKGFKGK